MIWSDFVKHIIDSPTLLWSDFAMVRLCYSPTLFWSELSDSGRKRSPEWTNVFNLTSVNINKPAFAILQLGPDCNAHMSVSFTEAKCNFKNSRYMVDFDNIFSKGMDLLFDLNTAHET